VVRLTDHEYETQILFQQGSPSWHFSFFRFLPTKAAKRASESEIERKTKDCAQSSTKATRVRKSVFLSSCKQDFSHIPHEGRRRIERMLNISQHACKVLTRHNFCKPLAFLLRHSTTQQRGGKSKRERGPVVCKILIGSPPLAILVARSANKISNRARGRRNIHAAAATPVDEVFELQTPSM